MGQGAAYRPRAALALLGRPHRLHRLPSSEVQTRLRLGQWDEALRTAGELQDIFGKEFFYVELMDHGLEIEQRVTKDLLRLAQEIGAPLLATNDSHYVRPEDRTIQDAMLCINSGSVLSDPDRFRFDGDTYYLRPGSEMRRLFSEMPQACDNTLLVAEQCDVHFRTVDEGASFMPAFPVPEGETDESWFIKECWRGMDHRFNGDIPEDCRKQAEYEISVITQMGFPGYFLVVADYINWAKAHGIRVGPGRGSGAGSMVAYAMGITELNPLRHGSSSSASSTLSASPCPISTSTSTSAGATRSSSTCVRSTAPTASARWSHTVSSRPSSP